MRKLLFWRRKRVPVIQLHGVIATRVGSLNLEGYAELIDAAFASARRGGAVVLDIESPGGSPVQSDLIASRIRRRATESGARVVAVIGEVGASGGYWLACSADEILANPMSIVGSIGVIGGGFGFEEAIGRLGVRRRLYTAGENKARLDPFSAERPQDVAFVQALLAELHERFKAWVRTRREGKLRAEESAVFDGGWMLGERAMALGLIDRLGDLESVVAELGGRKARPRVFKPRRRGLMGLLPRLIAQGIVDGAAEVMERHRLDLRA